MIYKVLYHENPALVPVRENTKAIYIEADSERGARKKIADRNIIIDFVVPVSGAYLEYEQQGENFKVENL